MKINKHGHHLGIEGGQLPFELPVFRGISAGEGGPHGYFVERDEQPILNPPHGYWSANSGLLPLISHEAARHGVPLEVNVHEPGIAPLPPPVPSGKLSCKALSRFATQNERGLIRLSPSMDEAEVIADLIRVFPSRRLVILAGHVGRLKRLQEKLQQRFAEEESMRRDSIPTLALVHDRQRLHLDVDDEIPQVILATYMGAADIELATSHIVLLLEATDIAQDRAQQPLEQVDAQFRLFGFVRADQTPDPLEDQHVWLTFGFEVIDLQSNGRVRRPVGVAWSQNQQHRLDPDLTDPSFAFRVYFHNERRNRRIAHFAEGLSGDAHPNVTILVEHLDHAIALGKLLEDWPIISSDSVDIHGLPGSVRTRLKHGRQHPPGRRQIVLADVARTFPGHESDTVIMAMGGPSVESLPASWMYQKDGPLRPLMVVDFKDEFNNQTRRWSQQRLEEYEKRDMFAPDVSPVEGRINRLMRQAKRNEQGGQR